MATPEDEIKDLREKNNELVQKVQYWKMTAAQRENEKLELMKEINELRLKLSRLRSGGAAQARKLDAALQSASEEALNHLVLASGAVARTIELAKSYMRDRQELDMSSPRWSNISGTPNTERVRRVPPMMGGQSIQPVVSLSRTVLNTSNPRSGPRSPNQSRNVTERAVPMHMLQDVYIPLTRIDATDLPGHNVESDTEVNNVEDSAEDLGLEDSNERSLEESQNIREEEEFEESRRLDAVTEDLEEEEEMETPPRSRTENPLEGPSWLLDRPSSSKSSLTRGRATLEPDSTTEGEEGSQRAQSGAKRGSKDQEKEKSPSSAGARAAACEFSPTVRRRKRASSPRPLPPHPPRRPSTSGRVLKVLVAKMRLDDEASPPKRASLDSPTRKSLDLSLSLSQASPARRSRDLPRDSPAKKPVRFDAPSPNGSTDARVIVSEFIQQNYGAGDAHDVRSPSVMSRDSHTHEAQDSRSASVMSRDSHVRDVQDSRSASVMSRDSHDSDSGGGGERGSEEGRTRRARKAVTYKEKPLNRKMRR